MKVCVVGLWHLGSVTAACLAAMGHEVIGLDANAETVANLRDGRPPLFEPGLAELVQAQLSAGRLSFATVPAEALRGAEVVWVAYDTPVDDHDVADVQGVVAKIEALLPHVADGALVLISSQLIAGCTRRLQRRCDELHPNKAILFGYSPENLRLGKAIEVFSRPDRVVVGLSDPSARSKVDTLLGAFADRILYMSVESAEVTKHALNAFLAMCVCFANEIATVCERVGADGKEVERALKSEKRIGPGAYLAPGAAFAGGTLARDVQYLKLLAREHDVAAILLGSIKDSNDRHREWVQRRLSARFGSLSRTRIAVLGLTYKPGTDTLRRSTSIELCHWLIAHGAEVTAHDPRVQALPSELSAVRLCADVIEAARGAHAIVIATPWPEYRELPVAALREVTAQPVVIDPHRIAEKILDVVGIEYLSVGSPARTNGGPHG